MLFGIYGLFQPRAKVLNGLSEVRETAEKPERVRPKNLVQGSDVFLPLLRF